MYGQDKSERCGFVQWLDEEWPQRAQEVILTLWDMVNKSIEKADKNLVDMMAEQALKNEVKEQKVILEAEKVTGLGRSKSWLGTKNNSMLGRGAPKAVSLHSKQ